MATISLLKIEYGNRVLFNLKLFVRGVPFVRVWRLFKNGKV